MTYIYIILYQALHISPVYGAARLINWHGLTFYKEIKILSILLVYNSTHISLNLLRIVMFKHEKLWMEIERVSNCPLSKENFLSKDMCKHWNWANLFV